MTRTARDLADFAKNNNARTRITNKGRDGYEVRAFVKLRNRDAFKAAAKAAGIRVVWNGATDSSTVSATIS